MAGASAVLESAAAPAAVTELTVVVPTLNEVGNIGPLLERLDRVLAGTHWECVFVDDDSQDGTTELLLRISRERSNVRFIHRIGRRGLSSACIEGILACSSPYIAVMDADLQHDEALLPKMLATLKAEHLDIVVGSRYTEGGSVGEFSSKRVAVSRLATMLSKAITKTEITDPMSGFFLVDRQFFAGVVRRMSGVGFKILLDMFASAERPVRVKELPYRFRNRRAGESKLDVLVSLEYIQLLADKSLGNILPVRFILFVGVGCFGLLLHLSILALLLRGLHLSFSVSQASAIVCAMTLNYFLNNQFTYRDRKLHGGGLWRGLLFFYIACAIGALCSFRITEALFNLHVPWYMAGLMGAVVGAVWNYGVNSTFTWQKKR
jgi:dolichol-phosphate mannosyltransferase